MNKTAKRIISFLCAAAVLSPSAYAMELDYYGENTVLFTEARSQLHFKGTVDGNYSNRMATIFVMMPGKTLADANVPENVAYMKSVSVDFDGEFEYKFGFDKESGVYPVYVLCGDEQFEDEYNYKSRDDITALFDKIKNGTVAYTDIEEYSENLGLDLSVVTKDGYKTTIITRLLEKKDSITNDNASVDIIKNVLKNCGTEFKYLEDIKTSSNWSVIPSLITNISNLTGVVYNYKGVTQQSVCTKLIGNEYTSAELLKTAFDRAVSDVLSQAPGNQGSITGGGGGGGGTVTGGGSSGNYIVSNDNSTSILYNDKNKNSNAFNDISDVEWAVKPINYLYANGIINGTGYGKFSPNDFIKREEIAKIIVNAFELADENAATTFTDTDSSMWHYIFIASAQSKGIVNGISQTKFGVGDYVTRQDLAVMIYNAAVLSGKGFLKTKTDFSDYGEIAEYAKTAVSSLAGDGIISGMGDGSFEPNSPATRAQATKIIYEVII